MTRALSTTGGSVGYRLEWNRARGVGGSTLHWEGTTLRLRSEDFRMRTLHGVAEDWPISYEEIEPYYGKAERALGVAGTSDDPWASARSTAFPLPPFPLSFSDGFFAGACRTLGIVPKEKDLRWQLIERTTLAKPGIGSLV